MKILYDNIYNQVQSSRTQIINREISTNFKNLIKDIKTDKISNPEIKPRPDLCFNYLCNIFNKYIFHVYITDHKL